MMKRMNMMALVLALGIGSQAYGFLIVFDPNNAFKDDAGKQRKYDIFTFVNEQAYQNMLEKEGGLKSKATKVSALAGAAMTGVAIVATVTGQEYIVAADAVLQTSGAFKKMASLGNLKDHFKKIVDAKYTIENIDNAGPGPGRNWICKSAETLKKSKHHPISSNQNIFYVIKDAATHDVLYADYGPAYGYFVFRVGKLRNADTGEQTTVGDLALITGTKTTSGQTIDPRSEGQLCPNDKTDLNLSTTVPIKLTETKGP